jgi:hypothetical protein
LLFFCICQTTAQTNAAEVERLKTQLAEQVKVNEKLTKEVNEWKTKFQQLEQLIHATQKK